MFIVSSISRKAFLFLFACAVFFCTGAEAQTDGAESTDEEFVDSRRDIAADRLLNYAKRQLGVRYKYAGTSPKTGFDCSGFVSYVFAHFEYKLPRSSRAYRNVGKKVSLKKCRKADILIFTGRNKSKRVPGHVGIVVSNSGGEIRFIHASSSRGIVISNTDSKYYKPRILGARSIIQ